MLAPNFEFNLYYLHFKSSNCIEINKIFDRYMISNTWYIQFLFYNKPDKT